MQIRKKLTFQFITIVALLLIIASVAIYFFSAEYRKEDFYSRLRSKGNSTAKLLLEVEEVDATLLRKIEKDNPGSLPRERITIYNHRNEVIYSTDEDSTIRAGRELLDGIRLHHTVEFRQGDFEVLGFLFTDRYDRFVIVAGAVDIYGLKRLQNLRTVLLIVFGVSVILIFVSGWIYSGRALKPISAVIRQVGNISISSLNLRVDEGKSKDEIAMLARTFNNMLDRLEGAFKMQKNFIANASHELRTPLTAITGQLEVLLMQERSDEDYRKAMTSVLEDMRSLNHTSNRLLLLAQASSEASETDFRDLRIDDIIWQARSEILRRNKDYDIEVAIGEGLDDEGRLTVTGNELLMKTAVTNLMDNGCKYSPNRKVNVTLEAAGGGIAVRFTDRGIGIPAEDIGHIFEPFHRGRNALTVKGHGIGLSLVERIVTLHQGSITVTSRLNEGTSFTMTLPLSGSQS